jgi:hypothetical protein
MGSLSLGSNLAEEPEVRELKARLSNLERQVDFLLRINGLDISRLREAPDEELLRYYRDAVHLLGIREEQFDSEVVQLWSELFCQLSEYEFTRLQKLVDYDHTWEPFYQLCIHMMTAIRHKKGFSRMPTLKNAYAYLEKARKNIRDSAVIMIKKYPDQLPHISQVLLKDSPLEFSTKKSKMG